MVLNLIYVFAICIPLQNNPVVFVLKGAALVSHFVKTLIHRLKFGDHVITKYYSGDQIKNMRWEKHVALIGERRDAYRVFDGEA